MNVNRISDRNHYLTRSSEVKESKKNGHKHNDSAGKEIKDEYIPSQQEERKFTYQKPTTKPDIATIQRLKEESEKNHSQLKEMVRQLLERQGLTFKDLDELETVVEIDEETRLKAQEMIGEGGPLSPEKVSDNILSFAKAISGGDPDKIDMLISAIEKGFKEAANMLGGELPEISKTTYDLVMEKMEGWREG